MINGVLTPTEIMAAAAETLLSAGYKELSTPLQPSSLEGVRLFEDPYGVVQVVVFDSWAGLVRTWANAQASLVELISKHVKRGEPKAWDGYLVLLTSGLLPTDAQEAVTEIRYDTSRVRKLLATGDELKTTADIKRLLLPLLPLAPDVTPAQQNRALELLPEILIRHGIDERISRTLIQAFLEHRQLMDSLLELVAKE